MHLYFFFFFLQHQIEVKIGFRKNYKKLKEGKTAISAIRGDRWRFVDSQRKTGTGLETVAGSGHEMTGRGMASSTLCWWTVVDSLTEIKTSFGGNETRRTHTHKLYIYSSFVC